MTADLTHPSPRRRSSRPPAHRWLPASLGARLLLAFVVVALSSVALLTAAALVGTGQGLAAAQRTQRQSTADRAAEAAATGYRQAGGWDTANLRPADAIATAAGAQLVIRDAGGAMVWPGRGMGMGPGVHRSGAGTVTTPVVVDGTQVGTVRLGYGSAIVPGRQVAWGWIVGAGFVALLLALAVTWSVTRWLTNPLAVLAATARAFARGDRTARAGLTTTGELGAVGAALDHLADQVVHTESVRRRLAADVAHELRTPLAALQAGLEELRDGYTDPDPARLAALHDQSLRLGRIVDDLAELAAAEAAALSLHRVDVDLTDLAEQALTARQAHLQAAGLRVHADLHRPLPVHADPDRIHQAIGNLLANAARYCRPGDQVTVTTSRDDGYAVVEVADTGPGIDPADLPYIFQRLRRGRTSHTVAGSGIGLAVVRELVAAHGGTVHAASTPDGGARFTIRLPASRPPTSSTPSMTDTTAQSPDPA